MPGHLILKFQHPQVSIETCLKDICSLLDNTPNYLVGCVIQKISIILPVFFTDSTPVHQLDSVRKQQNHHHHKRSNSLPSALNKKARMPDHGPGMNLLFSNPITKTFRFHSGLGKVKYPFLIMLSTR